MSASQRMRSSTFADGLDTPRGLALSGSDVFVSDSGSAEGHRPGQVLRISSDGSKHLVLEGAHNALAGSNDQRYVDGLAGIAADGKDLLLVLGAAAFLEHPIVFPNRLVRITQGKDPKAIFDFVELEQEQDPDGAGIDSNAAAIAVGHDGSLRVVDAGGNWTAKLSSTGDVLSVTAFHTDTGEDAVPTAVAIGPDGDAYVALFRCRPERALAGAVVRIHDDGTIETMVTNLSQPIAVAFDRAGRLYVLSFSRGYAPGTGQLLRISDGRQTVLADKLDFPSALAIADDGLMYVAQLHSPGGGQGRADIFRVSVDQ